LGNKNINEIRKSITKRKQNKRQVLNNSKESNYSPTEELQEEEKHGYFPFSTSQKVASKGDDQSFFVPAIVFKFLLAGILFFSTALLLRVDTDVFEKPKNFVLTAMTKEFNFAKIQGWYRENLGSPFAFLNNNQTVEHVSNQGLVLPVNGIISESFQETGEGVLIEVTSQEDMSVTSLEAGTVIFAGKEKGTGKTVIIQHEDGSNSIYGNLHDIEVFQYQFVSKNQVIGSLETKSGETSASLYFAIKEEENSYIDPVKVIQVDDQR
jgi:stage IV sporulation protein FA